MSLYDDVIFSVVKEAQALVEQKLSADVLYFSAEIRMHIFQWFRETIENLAKRNEKRGAIAIFLTTPGGQAEAAEKLVEVVRHHYPLVYFVIHVAAMSAGTIFCMSGDKIYMDYSSSLGPIDPQVPDREGKFLVPALGHLDMVRDLVDKSHKNTISPAEFEWLMRTDLAMLRFYEQAKDLSIALLERWLVQYKFKDWTHHQTTSPGAPVTEAEKQTRAREIAVLLSNNSHWHSHGRMIGMSTLQALCRLKIDDYGVDKDLQEAVRRFNDTLSDHLARSGVSAFLYSSHVS